MALVVKNLPANEGDLRDQGSIPGWGRFPGEGNGSPLQYSCLENPMNRGAWRATLHRVTVSLTQLSTDERYVYAWLIHFAVEQKPTQHCKATILQ